MPISPENKNLYPKNWHEISNRIRYYRAQGRCEHIIDGERCKAENGRLHPITGSRVVLTVAHLDHNPSNCDDDNLEAMCQRCHLRYDAHHHRACDKTKDMFKQEKAKFMNLSEKFKIYDVTNPHIYKLFKQYSALAKNRGFVRYSAKAIFERIRWYLNIETKGDSFKLNNNYTAFYARKLMDEDKSFDSFFETREQKAA